MPSPAPRPTARTGDEQAASNTLRWFEACIFDAPWKYVFLPNKSLPGYGSAERWSRGEEGERASWFLLRDQHTHRKALSCPPCPSGN